MNIENKEKLENLIRRNKYHIAKKQLLHDLKERYDVDLTNRVFLDYNLSESIFRKVYGKIRNENIEVEKWKI